MNARDWALLELDRRQLPGWKRSILARSVRDRNPPENRLDRALAEQIIIGVIKNHLLLSHVAEVKAQRPLSRIDPLVLKILEIAQYQLRFLDRVPHSAAVNEAVEQCRRYGRSHAASFVNAVLRNAARQPQIDLPDPDADPLGYAALALSHPPELFRRLIELMSVADALRFCRHDNEEPPTLVRLFQGQSPHALAVDGVSIRPHEQPGMYVVHPARRPVLEAWAKRGIAQVQDATSAQAVVELRIDRNQRVLDRCAGLGTKTIQIHEYTGGQGRVDAVDPSHPRCTALRELISARGIANIHVHEVAMLCDSDELRAATFDRILVDAPCSNSGVLARRPEARYAQDDRSLESLLKLQKDILNDTASHTAAGGLFVYSTCSIWREENEKQVAGFLERHPQYALLWQRVTLPGFDSDPARYHDGGFVALMQRTR